MGELFVDYEKDFGILSADIVAKTSKIPNLHGGKNLCNKKFIVLDGCFMSFFRDATIVCIGIMSILVSLFQRPS